MQYILDKWTKEYFDKIDLSNVPTLNISKTDEKVIVTVDDEYIDELEFAFSDEIMFEGMTPDMEQITRFGMKLEEIYDQMIEQANGD
ncbi:MAG: hypothetical protein J6M90_00495 [Oscillospiraceae bacterium]|nr:hypothetical protein [Oscillospiraceae bacterium]